jgi:hypothetical protein
VENRVRKHGDYIQRQYMAQRAVYLAVKSGELVRTPCEICGSEKVHGHHYQGYAVEDRLKVQWLCPKHHKEAHIINAKYFEDLEFN